jgi:VanZ family protein
MELLRRPLAAILGCAPLLWTLFAAWLAILFFFSGSPPPEDMPTLIPYQDKFFHFVFFAGGACALAGALKRSFGARGFRLLAGTVLTLALAGAFDEYNQQFVPGRAGLDPFDWLADLCGALTGTFVLARLHRFVVPDSPDI